MSLNDLLKVYQFDNKLRLGSIGDGGYVIGNLNYSYDAYFSCGVSNEESFSRDFINTYEMKIENCFAFDGTIFGYPYSYTEKIIFIKKNIGYNNTEFTTNLKEYMNLYNNIFLKMDIEGGEYPWILSLEENELNKFKQIVIEFHGINDNSWDSKYYIKLECLKKLNKTHYIIHAHGNNHCGTTNNIPDVLELTYIRKDYFSQLPPLNSTPLPIPNLDFPNCILAELNLNFYPFVN